MAFEAGARVEVAGSSGDGFRAIWFDGRIEAVVENGPARPTALVSFPAFEDDEGEEHVLGGLRLRPAQPAEGLSLLEYQPGDAVDVLENEVWWHAVVCERCTQQGLKVHFTGCNERNWVADPALLRPGKVWVAGQWHKRPLPADLPKNLIKPATAQQPKQQQQGTASKAAVSGAHLKPTPAGTTAKSRAGGRGKAAAAGGDDASPSGSNDENQGEREEAEMETVMVRRGARQRESCIVMINGKPVLKINNYDLESGERSVFDQELQRPKGGARGAAAQGPSVNWVAVQRPAKRPRGAAGRGKEEGDSEGEEGGEEEDEEAVSPAPAASARWNADLLAHNAAVKADGKAKAGLRLAFLERHLEAIRPFIPAEVAAGIRSKAAAAKAAGLPALPPPVEVQPECLHASLREYQLEGLRWLAQMWDEGVNCILADEMGLGKTLQTISLLSYLKFERNVEGPHLVVVPLSVLPSWLSEFARFSPQMRVVRLHTSDHDERNRLKREYLSQPGSFDVAVTTYESVKSKDWSSALSRLVRWRYLVLDEGHKIKNEETQLAQAMRNVQRQQTLLLTGTPLQNNLHELYALLSYLFPDVFTSAKPFDDAFDLRSHKVDVGRLEAAHAMLRPFVLRRLKQEVELDMPPLVETRISCPLTHMQTFWYRRLLLKDKSALLQLEQEVLSEGKVKFNTEDNSYKKLMSLLMQLRKTCNHPFLFPGAEPDFDGHTTDESIVEASGKMVVLDRLLAKLKARGHRVVLFSQFNMQLDLLEDYMNLRGYKYSRLDGSTNRVQRMIDIKLFNRPGSDVFIYLLNTRAGGLGVNLQQADTCILFDSDWNPQQDLQAMARVHRIGQTKPVHVYRLCTDGTVEERIQHRAEKKLFLDQMVNRGSVAGVEVESLTRSELLSMLRFGCDRIFKNEAGRPPSSAELDAIIDRSSNRAAKLAAVKEEEGGEGAAAGGAGAALLVEAKASAAQFDAETAPLSTFMFGGQDYKHINNMQDISRAYWAEQGKGMRQKKARLVQIGEHAVLRENMYDLAKGEPSIFEREAAGARAAAGQRKKPSNKPMEHQDFCQICWDGGDLVCCNSCPASYHASCLGVCESELAAKWCWSCPQHTCSVCARKASAVGGMLFRCEGCPHAFCEDHLPSQADVVMRCARFDALGMKPTSTACYVRCSPECAEFVAALEAGGAGAAGQ